MGPWSCSDERPWHSGIGALRARDRTWYLADMRLGLAALPLISLASAGCATGAAGLSFERLHLRETQGSGDKQDAVGTHGTGFKDLIAVNHEILAQDR